MSESVFLRLLGEDDQPEALRASIEAVRQGRTDDDTVHAVDPSSFEQVPGSPFAYWVSERIRRLFTELPPFESEGRTAKQGLATADDFRFVRAWWEVPPERILDGANGPDWRQDLDAFQAWCRERTYQGKRWVPFAKGGAYSPYYADVYLVVNWENDGEEIKNRVNPETGKPYSNVWQLKRTEREYLFRPGLTWPLRTNGLSFRAMPAGSVFGHKGPSIFLERDDYQELVNLLAIINSLGFFAFVQAMLARVSLAQSFEVGLIQSTPITQFSHDDQTTINAQVAEAIRTKMAFASTNHQTHGFVLPALLQTQGPCPSERLERFTREIGDSEQRLTAIEREIDEQTFELYGIPDRDRERLMTTLHGDQSALSEADSDADVGENAEELQDIVDPVQPVHQLLSYSLGCSYGRWDIRFARAEREQPEYPDPFDPLPVCSPGMLTSDDDLPLDETPADYPIEIDCDGILVDDPHHPDDVIARIRTVLEAIWGDRAEAIEAEICELLGERDLRSYFRKSSNSGFWMGHVRAYSKKPRKAPIYWLLQSRDKHYALWLYYHRLDRDTLHKALVNYVEPKLQLERNRLSDRKAAREAADASSAEAKRLEREIADQEDFLNELEDFEERLRRVADLNPPFDRDDGVVLNVAPLHELVPWNEAEKRWTELIEGKYEWSAIGAQLREQGWVED